MRALILLIMLFALPLSAFAGMAEARYLAKSMNCTVKNIVEVTKTSGNTPTTTYKVDCDMPTTASDEEKKANGTLLIRCEVALCTLFKKGE